MSVGGDSVETVCGLAPSGPHLAVAIVTSRVHSIHNIGSGIHDSTIEKVNHEDDSARWLALEISFRRNVFEKPSWETETCWGLGELSWRDYSCR